VSKGAPTGAPDTVGVAELFRLQATRSGSRVVQLRVLSTADGYAVESHVAAVDGRHGEAKAAALSPFATEAEAKAFVDEAAVALQYLGCHVRGGSV
jgi:hypothetical protein